MDDHLEMAYEDANGGVVLPGQEEFLADECDECGAAPGVLCLRSCPNFEDDFE